MNVNRRSLLKGMAVGGLAGAAMASSGLSMAASALGSKAAPTLALVSGEVAESAFLQGLSASPVASQIKVQRTDLNLDFMLSLEKSLRSGKPQRIIGLVDDASATLIVDMARSAGARIHWLDQHNARNAASEQWASTLGYSLASLGNASAKAPQINSRPASLTGTYVSFSIEA